MGDPKHLGHVRAVRSVDGVFDAYRVTQYRGAVPAGPVAAVSPGPGPSQPTHVPL